MSRIIIVCCSYHFFLLFRAPPYVCAWWKTLLFWDKSSSFYKLSFVSWCDMFKFCFHFLNSLFYSFSYCFICYNFALILSRNLRNKKTWDFVFINEVWSEIVGKLRDFTGLNWECSRNINNFKVSLIHTFNIFQIWFFIFKQNIWNF